MTKEGHSTAFSLIPTPCSRQGSKYYQVMKCSVLSHRTLSSLCSSLDLLLSLVRLHVYRSGRSGRSRSSLRPRSSLPSRRLSGLPLCLELIDPLPEK